MIRKRSDFQTEIRIKVAKAAMAILSIMAFVLMLTTLAAANAKAAVPSQNQVVLTILLRDSYGQPLAGVLCEVLSYDWGLQVGKPYAVIAKGETDAQGIITFDDSVWPSDGYRFHFSPTSRMQPANTYFMSDSDNQYRGYPGAHIGGQTETQAFVIASDGLAYNDLSGGTGRPQVSDEPVAGLQQPRVTLMPSKDYFATVRAATATAFASGATVPPTPAPPPTFSGRPQTALNANNIISINGTPQVAGTPQPIAAAINNDSGTSSPTMRGGSISNSKGKGGDQASTGSDLLSSIVLAVFGVVCFILFWRYRRFVYKLIGVSVKTKVKKNRKRAKAKPGSAKPGLWQQMLLKAKSATNAKRGSDEDDDEDES